MSSPTISDTWLGERTEYVFTQPLEQRDWARMSALLEDATMMGVPAVRFISNDATRVVITHTTSAVLRVSTE